jgi:hypothetical protein
VKDNDNDICTIAMVLLVCIAGLVFSSGCALMKTTKEKAVNTGGRLYGIRVDTAASTGGTIAPSVVFGSAEWSYLSIPADTKNARLTVESEEAGWFTNSVKARRRVTIDLSESPLAADLPPLDPLQQ